MMNLSPLSITRVDDAQLKDFIGTANDRLIVMSPGVSLPVAQSIEERWKALGPQGVKVILDLDPEVARLGYGTLDGLVLLQNAAKKLGAVVNSQPGIRIGLVIADNSTLIFAPIPQLIEAGSQQPFHPNAVALDFVPASVAQELGTGAAGRQAQTIGLEAVAPKQVEAMADDLKANPPLSFDVARVVRVFNAQFEFVEFELRGGLLSRKTVPIPSDLMGLANDPKTKRLLKSSFRVVDGDGLAAGDQVNQLKKFIVGKYLIQLPGYGLVVLRQHKADFESAVGSLHKYMLRFQRQIVRQLQKELDANRGALLEALLPAVSRNWPDRWQKFIHKPPQPGEIEQMLEGDLANAFGSAREMLEEMHIKLIFKGVTYELLNDATFVGVAQQAIRSLPALHEEFNAAKASTAKVAR